MDTSDSCVASWNNVKLQPFWPKNANDNIKSVINACTLAIRKGAGRRRAVIIGGRHVLDEAPACRVIGGACSSARKFVIPCCASGLALPVRC